MDNECQLENVKSARLLGVIFSEDLKWEEHIQNIIDRASRRLFSLILLRSTGVPMKTIWSYYCTCIRSILLYAYPVWCNVGTGSWDRAEKVERRAIKITGLCTESSLRETADMICLRLMKKIEKYYPAHPLSELVVKREESSTRNKRTIAAHWAKTTRLRDSFMKYADRL
jgi:hypothetical protein